MDILEKTPAAIVGGLLATVITLAATTFGGLHPEPERPAFAPSQYAPLALEVCERPETVFTLYITPAESHYQATLDIPSYRVDLTFREGINTVVVEELVSNTFLPRPEQIDQRFWACLDKASRDDRVKTREATH